MTPEEEHQQSEARSRIVEGIRSLQELGRQVDAARLQEAAAVPFAVDPDLKTGGHDNG